MTDITIKIEAPELASAINALAAAFSGGSVARAVADATLPPETAEPEKPKRAPRAAKTDTPATSGTSSTVEAEATSSTEPAAETASDPASDGSAPDGLVYEDVRGKVLELTAKRGREATVGLLAQFATEAGEPAAKGTELQESDWAEFVEKATALIEGDLA